MRVPNLQLLHLQSVCLGGTHAELRLLNWDLAWAIRATAAERVSIQPAGALFSLSAVTPRSLLGLRTNLRHASFQYERRIS